MCGIVGVIGARPAAPILLEGLRRLEYRGYDSAGIATLVNGHIERRRAEGKLVNLATALERMPVIGTTGIGHTRWATHGAPTESNAHPHGTDLVSVVHTDEFEQSFLQTGVLSSPGAWVTARRRAGGEVRALPRSRHRRSSFAASMRTLGPCWVQPLTSRS